MSTSITIMVKAMSALEWVSDHPSLFSLKPTSWEEEKTLLEHIYNYHGQNHVCSRVGKRPSITVQSQTHIVGGGGENFTFITSRPKPCLFLSGLELSITVQSQPTMEEEKKLNLRVSLRSPC